VREHEAPHVRSPEMQILDALVRIEEMLEKFRVDFPRTRREQMGEEAAVPEKAVPAPKATATTRKPPRAL
jgi:hypothetical protein